jgi:O-antigen/teichoic acid export membrane protein
MTLVTVPIFLSVIGDERYGVLAIIWLIFGYSAFFDFGLGRATAQRLASLPKDHKEGLSTTFWTALAMNSGFGLLGFIVVLSAAYLIFNTAALAPLLLSEIKQSLVWIALMVPVVTISSTLNGTLIGRERFLELNLISTISLSLTQILPLVCALLIGPELNVLIPAIVGARASITLILLYRCYRDVGHQRRPSVCKKEATHLLRFGSWVAMTSLIGPLMIVMDRFAIAALSGAAGVALYTIPFQLAEKTTLVTRAITSTLFPVFSGQSQIERDRLGKNAQSVIIGLSTPITVLAILMLEPFLVVWISLEFANNASFVGKILLVGFWLNSRAAVPYAILQAKGRPDLVAKCHAIELIPYLALLFAGLKLFGIAGAAGAFVIRVLVDTVLLSLLAGQNDVFRAKLLAPLGLVLSALLVASSSPLLSQNKLTFSIVLVVVTGLWALNSLRDHFDRRNLMKL